MIEGSNSVYNVESYRYLTITIYQDSTRTVHVENHLLIQSYPTMHVTYQKINQLFYIYY